MNGKLHIQHVLLSLQPGGLENGVVNVVNNLSRDRFRSSICCLKHAGEFAARLDAGVAVHELHWQGGNDPRLVIRLARLLRATRPDIVHTRNPEAFFYGFLATKLAGVNCLVHSEHGRVFDDRPLRFRIQNWFSRGTQAIFTVSEQLKRDLVNHVGIAAQRVQVLYNGVDVGRFNAIDRGEARRRMALNEEDLVIGSVGRLVPVKNYQLLLKAVAALARKNVTVLLAGEGPERAALAALAESLGLKERVRILGHRDDIADILGAMDVFVLPSVSEGMSNTLLEAMAAGVPNIASNVGGNPEIVCHGRDGFLFKSGDQADLTARLEQLCSDIGLRRSLAAAGRARAMSEFSIGAMIQRYERLYLSTFAGAQSPR